MGFYYISIFSLMFLAVLYVVSLGALWFVWSRVFKREFSGPVVWSLVAFVIVAPWLEEFWIAYNFGQLCRKDAGIVVSKTVEVDGFYDDVMGWGVRQVSESGYKFMESKSAVHGGKWRVERADNNARDMAINWYENSNPGKKPSPDYYITYVLRKGEKIVVSPDRTVAWRVAAIDKPAARYHYTRNIYGEQVAHKVTRQESRITDSNTGQLIGRYVEYGRRPYWFYVGFGAPSYSCDGPDGGPNSKRNSLIYRDVLKPKK